MDLPSVAGNPWKSKEAILYRIGPNWILTPD